MIEALDYKDIDIVMDMIEKGRDHIKQYNIKQWTNGYPNIDTIKNDIKNNGAFVLNEDDEILAYFAMFDYEKTYDYIKN